VNLPNCTTEDDNYDDDEHDEVGCRPEYNEVERKEDSIKDSC
jgi:hypothetical protein